MRYIFYADVYFLQNFLMKVAAIYLALYCNKNSEFTDTLKGVRRILFIAFLGTALEILGLMLVNSYSLFLLWVNIVELPLMFFAIIRSKKIKWLRLLILGYFFTMVINSVLEALWNQLGERGGYIFYLLFSVGLVIVVVRIGMNYKRMQKGIFDVEIIYQGSRIKLKGLYDSGNRLIDPHSKKGVHIVAEQTIANLCDLERGELNGEKRVKAGMATPALVPYRALGNTMGMLEVYYMDELIIEGQREIARIKNCPLGVTKDNLFEGKNYEIILNEEVF